MQAKRIRVSGTVQGVGFRPFIYQLAEKHGLCGWVCNTSSSVDIFAEGASDRLDAFLSEISISAPPLAKIDFLTHDPAEPQGISSFEIRASIPQPGAFQPVSADIALCADCRRELFTSQDRRYLYPFINCTNCGPRLTIIQDLPYDRAQTSMAPFEMCPDCRREYEDPRDRRFHAEPTACPVCGPRVWIADSTGVETHSGLDAILQARRMLRGGKIVAVRGVGGFHLACDACNPEAVRELRRRKQRRSKPLAILLPDIHSARIYCAVQDAERELLESREKPIVILRRRESLDADTPPIVEDVAPGSGTLGVLLPYSPLHELLIATGDSALEGVSAPRALVLTSGNLSEEPIASGNEEAVLRLGAFADAFLFHNREIVQRCDDSVARVMPAAGPQLLRRSRGFAPSAIRLPHPASPVLAVGAELKNAFCLTREGYAFLSPHVGDMENLETLNAFEESVERFQRLFHTKPEILAHDLHPGYLSTRWACEHGGSAQRIAIQHHHAHAAACMAENGLDGSRKTIALAFDGTGYGEDGHIWGAEVLIADYRSCERFLHMEYLPLPGGDAAIRKPWRTAVGFCEALGISISDTPFCRSLDAREVKIVQSQTHRGVNAPKVSSMGRLFDAAAALTGLAPETDYEAQGAIEFEEAAHAQTTGCGEYPYRIQDGLIRVGELFAALVEDTRQDVDRSIISARFHRTIRSLAVQACRDARSATGIRTVALTGGVWQNALLTGWTADALGADGFEIYTHRLVPTNDGGIALGQAVIATERIR